MKAATCSRRDDDFTVQDQSRDQARRPEPASSQPTSAQITSARSAAPQTADHEQSLSHRLGLALMPALNGWIDVIAPCPWSAHIGLSSLASPVAWTDQAVMQQDAPQSAPTHTAAKAALDPKATGRTKSPTRLYSPAERQRRDSTPWTIVQGILAPLQFFAFAVSLILIVRYMTTGQGYQLATGSILIKTALLYAIMITGSIWEKVVFGKWLFAPSFFWEDVFSMLVLGLQTAYLAALYAGWGSPAQQMMIAVAAYAAYAINASQFLLKLRAARLEGASAAFSGATA